MTVLVAGGSGTIGLPLVRALATARHHVVALARSTRGERELRQAGVSLVVADALNADEVAAAVNEVRPTHVVHQLTALPRTGPRRPGDIDATNLLRVAGTRHLLNAAINAGAKRFVAGSFAPLAPRGSAPADPPNEVTAAIASMEKQVRDATAQGRIEGVILRYGMFYGPGVPSTEALVASVRARQIPLPRHDAGQLPFIHIADAVSATVAALDLAPPGSTYEIVDDQPASFTEVIEAIADRTGSSRPFHVPGWLLGILAPYAARMMSMRVALSNARARSDLGWRPEYPTIAEGLSQMLRHAA